jgi:hypothetical protein
MVEEKRACSRYSFSGEVAYGSSDVTINGSLANNISLSGISLKVQGFVPMGTILELELCLPSGVLWTKAEVVRIREISAEECYEIGLKFAEDEACKRAVGKYIDDCRLSNNKSNEELKSHG